MVEVFTWIDEQINIGILALGLSIIAPGIMILGTDIKNERLGQFVFSIGLLLIPVCLILGFGGAYLMTR